MKSLQYSIYKGMTGKFGAVQFNFQPPHYYNGKQKDFEGDTALDNTGKLRKSEGWEQREGAVFLEIAPTVGPNKYDWEKKITIALSITDMGKLVTGFMTSNEVKLTHDPGAKTDAQGAIKKYLNLTSPEGVLERGALLSVSQTAGSDKMSYMVPLTTDECIVIKELLSAAIPKALNWT